MKLYKDNIITYNLKKKTHKRLIQKVGFARGITFLVSLGLLFYSQTGLFIGVSALMFVLFLVLLKFNNTLRTKLSEIEAALRINEHELRLIETHDFSYFHSGDEFVNPEHPFSDDMDLFGKTSVFQYLNRTITCGGKLKFAQSLMQTYRRKAEILQRQEAVRELCQDTEFRERFAVLGTAYAPDNYFSTQYLHTHDDLGVSFAEWFSEAPVLKKTKIWLVISYLAPTITVFLTGLAVFGGLPYIYAVLFGMLNLTFVGTKLKSINLEHSKLSRFTSSVQVVRLLSELISKNKFKTPLLKSLQENISGHGVPGTTPPERLEKLLKRLDYRLNFLVGFMLNSLFLWDIHVIRQLDSFRKAHAHTFDLFLDAVYTVDSLNSFSGFAYNNPEFSYPAIDDANFKFEIKQGGHFLIHRSKRVDNDFTITGLQKIGIITGANMAGKSTFLRTVGVNIILASAGSVVCAEKMSYSPINLYTSIRSRDSLSENASYFFAELMRIRKIIETLNQGEKLFVIIDEMLRGTNSKDKHEGSRGLILKLLKYNAVGLVATHDVQLGELSQTYPENIFNRRFESEITDGELFFDYKMKDGVSRHLNATFLMQKYGIIDELQS